MVPNSLNEPLGNRNLGLEISNIATGLDLPLRTGHTSLNLQTGQEDGRGELDDLSGRSRAYARPPRPSAEPRG